ncbi:zwei Ig domain protein zig-8 isoform X1 [Drosophila mojavensis]|uniref:zwei Ig domain protein zig-8 isoform X1 n=2 Tax=Drosophila mojavensis TaxID=7230 RepID=UPI001CD0CF94|nr:zwei Ig domain protein zig-8 isoform X1 [Drosophila mojavensis]XP_043865300.1 zwei Ig domain protein zig-8 isoform X1 [Drosophila mojavensis]XP_043865301.1 zwei Ig domain protein zig-8 isoform X1 [Drosophila mojavensis]XP_043865302.1 zwei Ig domain protein zig-8 isoform X1 [Drosophila mojavensis]XP_043865303.1 zwei Ig domain protein zig-8 isoform X1 [Drosophila mojavensis]XP_043865304.1 zwei Ig domain protein zig-8 isoform X1 [Drosophila mojavensis]
MSPNWLLFLKILILLTERSHSASKRFFTDFLQDLPTPGTGGPSFDTTINSNITGLVGKTVKLTCRVKNLGNRTVSWVRHRDIHLLTVGRYTYTSDQRFEAMHSPHAEDWTLRIRYAQRKDSGIYECQISTTPPIGHSVYLNIVEPVTEVIGGPELHINKGSTINLTCIVRFAPEPPPTVIWSHNRQIINFDSPRGGISLVTEKGILTTSRLLVQKAIQQDSGLYTCTPSNANPTSVRVHIVDGEHPAAMHHGNSAPLQPPELIALVLLSCGLLFFLKSHTLSIHQDTNHYNKSAVSKTNIPSSIFLANCRSLQRQRSLRNKLDNSHMPPTT